jgi:5'-nucleotidase
VKILITNDDGYNASGIQLLEKIVRSLYKTAEIFIYAPHNNCSATGRGMTSSEHVQVREIEDRRYIVYGLPIDCVISACQLHDFGPDDIVFSGINNGWNVGQAYFYMSGTAQAAQYAGDAFDVPGVALSCAPGTIENIESEAGQIIRLIKDQGHRSGMINVNFPEGASNGKKLTKLGLFRHRGGLSATKKKGPSRWYDLYSYSRIETSSDDPETDAGAVMSGHTSITLLQGAELVL